jgi:hypothetical protein
MKFIINWNKNTIKFVKENWKLGIHIMFRTKHFGTNNKWWEESTFWYRPWYKTLWKVLRIRPFIEELKLMKMRMSPGFGFISKKQYAELFGPTDMFL